MKLEYKSSGPFATVYFRSCLLHNASAILTQNASGKRLIVYENVSALQCLMLYNALQCFTMLNAILMLNNKKLQVIQRQL